VSILGNFYQADNWAVEDITSGVNFTGSSVIGSSASEKNMFFTIAFLQLQFAIVKKQL
jgi:hypothetical protein